VGKQPKFGWGQILAVCRSLPFKYFQFGPHLESRQILVGKKLVGENVPVT